MKNYARLTPEGTRDVLFRQAQTEYEVAAHLRDFFTQYGYQEVRTPGIEYYDVFGAADKYFPQESMYKSTNRNGRLVVMRPDATIPIARLVSTKLRHRPMPLRLYYDQMIYRSSESLNGFSHEMHQNGVELIGAESSKSDVEMLALACETFRTTGFNDYRLEIGHVGIVEELLQALNAKAEVSQMVREALEEKNFSRLRQVLEPYEDRPAAGIFLKLPRLFGGEEIFQRALALFSPVVPTCVPIVEELAERYKEAQALCAAERLIVDFSLANQADYYSGIVFRGYIGGAGVAVISGGRYDRLFKDFGLNVPAIGFGVRIGLLAQVLNERVDVSETPLQLLYADGKDIAAALHWRRSQPGVIALSMADSVAEAMAEAVSLGANALLCYCDGQIETKEVRDA